MRPHLTDLDWRTLYDAVLIFNHTDRGGPTVTGIAGGLVKLSEPRNMHQGRAKIRTILEEFINRDEPFTGGVRDPHTTDLLWQLAHQGVSLYNSLLANAAVAGVLQGSGGFRCLPPAPRLMSRSRFSTTRPRPTLVRRSARRRKRRSAPQKHSLGTTLTTRAGRSG